MKHFFFIVVKQNFYKIKMILKFIFNTSQISTFIFIFFIFCLIMISYAFFRNFFKVKESKNLL